MGPISRPSEREREGGKSGSCYGMLALPAHSVLDPVPFVPFNASPEVVALVTLDHSVPKLPIGAALDASLKAHTHTCTYMHTDTHA